MNEWLDWAGIASVITAIAALSRLFVVERKRTRGEEARKDKDALVDGFSALASQLGKQLTDANERFTEEMEDAERRWKRRLEDAEGSCVRKLDELEAAMRKRIRQLERELDLEKRN